MNREEYNNIHNHQSEVDPLDIWAAIEPQVDALNEKRRKRRGFFFWLGSGLFVLLMAFGLFWGANNWGTSANSNTSSNSIANVSTITNSNSSVSVNLYTNVSSNSNSNSNANANANASANANSNSSVNTNSNTSTANDEVSLENVDNLTKEPVIVLEQDVDKVYSLPVISIIPSLELQFLKTDRELPELKQELDIEELLNEETIRNGPIKFRLALNAGVSFVKRNTSERNNDTFNLLLLRENTEQLLEARHLGVQFMAEHKSGFGLSIGINQTKIAERFDFSATIIDSTLNEEGIQAIYTDLDGNTTTTYGDVYTGRTTTETNKIYNSHRLLEIPVIVSYHKQWNAWELGTQAGVFINLSMKSEGKILEDASTIITIEDQTTPIYKSKVGLAYHFGLSVKRNIRPNLDLTISPLVRVYSGDFTTTTYSLSQKYTLFGGNVGLAYGF